MGFGQAEFYLQETTRDRKPSKWRFVRHTGWVHSETGEVSPATQYRAEKGGFRYRNPRYSGQVSPLFGVKRARRKRFWRRIAKGVLGPTGIGFLLGYALPGLVSAVTTAALTTGIAVVGYVAPPGSWLRRFSIGSGVGGGLYAAQVLAREAGKWSQWAKLYLGKDPAGSGLEPGTRAWSDNVKFRNDARARLRKKYGGSIWRRIIGDPVE